jgi:hypothetical protein
MSEFSDNLPQSEGNLTSWEILIIRVVLICVLMCHTI